MKYFLFSFLLLSITLSSCDKNSKGKIKKDCTGTYLRVNNKDFKVCNADILDEYDENETIECSYKKLNNCDFEPFSCELYHPYDGIINITKID